MGFPNIQTVSADYVQGSFALLPLAGERARGALFFAREIDAHMRKQELKIARRYFRAALSEFRSIFDLLSADFRDQADGLSQQWGRSCFKLQLESQPLVCVLRKVRDFAVHSSLVTGTAKQFVVTVLGQGPEREESIASLFIDHLERTTLGRYGSDLAVDHVEWFNHQATFWPAHLLIQEAVYQTSMPLQNFLARRRPDAG